MYTCYYYEYIKIDWSLLLLNNNCSDYVSLLILLLSYIFIFDSSFCNVNVIIIYFVTIVHLLYFLSIVILRRYL